MNKPMLIKKGDKIAIISLSSGILGEPFVKHQLELGKKRIEALGFEVVYTKNALKGSHFLRENPDMRAQDLKDAFLDESIKGIICAIGGDDTYKTISYLLEDQVFVNSVKHHPKFFMGYSDTTVNHLMFYKLGMVSFYGPCFLVDFAELDQTMLPYTENQIKTMLLDHETFPIKPSEFWFEERTDFSEKSLNTSRIKHDNTIGFQVLRGKGAFQGTLLGGCLESLYDMLEGTRYQDEVAIIKKYDLFPSEQTWQDKVIFLETSEEKIEPSMFKTMIQRLDKEGVFKAAKVVLFGKPQDGIYQDEYAHILLDITKPYQIPIMANLHFGHAHPKTILPYGLNVLVDLDQKALSITEKFFKE